MKIKQFRYPADNLGYLIYGNRSAAAIDGGAVNEILSFLKDMDLELIFVTNTHSHFDHTTGNKSLLDRSGASFLDHRSLIGKGAIELDGEKISIHRTPGHTENSIIFHFDNILVSGDTFFNGKAGTCFSGNFRGFLESIKLIMGFPEDTIIYAGHDYVERHMETARKLEPDNKEIDIYLKNYDPAHVCATLKEEMKVNPSLRFNDKKMISILRARGLAVDTEYDRWWASLGETVL